VLATKFGNQRRPDGTWIGVNGRPEDELLATVRELGIGFVAYSPLGRGFLSGQITSPDDFGPGDFRLTAPRYLEENLGALDVKLTPGELASIDAVAPRGVAAGDRYGPAQMATVNG
jgi:aryl-alcohol dehydrogenase-like predicted oxidoreductase